ncbi:NAD(+)/NADH kinase [Halocalculus aciditolerans]|uniref:NAD kinase n=1 Tax=Halocalculus aciditolerans TaxID=1383812 RepID=A0A830FFN6_9EURY|nr:NAD(+)/NADH kinase [Halocalculus aciditolerans]GGL50383.1 NAD(+) kinase [Halocalculus aciditolerans]
MLVGIVAQRGNARAAYLAADVRELLRDEGVSARVDEATAADIDVEGWAVDSFDACDLVVSIGGDGTFLFAARGADGTPVLGVNLGEVGFLAPVSPDDAVDAVAREVERFRETGSVRARDVPRITASAGDAEWSLTPALNEVVVLGSQRGHGQGVNVEVRVDESLYASGRADGVLLATPAGSTAYNLSEGGPLVTPAMDGFVLNQLCADDAMPPLVVGSESEVSVRVADAESVVVTSDGADRVEVDPPSVVTLERADVPARVAGPDTDFFKALNKLE